MLRSKAPLITGLLIFAFAIVAGLCVYQDYGVSWDEPLQRDMGLVSYGYVFENDATGLHKFIERDHGVGFELPLVILEKKIHITDSRDLYLMRHLVTYLFFVLSAFCGYWLAYRLLKNHWLAALGFLMLVFTPRIFAHAFFNCKDIPFLSACLIAMLFTQMAFDKHKPLWYAIMGITWGYAVSIRIPGILPVVIIGCFLMIDIITQIARRQEVGKQIVNSVAFGVFFCLALYACWPLLWDNPVKNFTETYASMSHFRWDAKVLFMGNYIKGTELPAGYVPVWMGITLPTIWLLAGVAGLAWIIFLIAKKPLQYITNTPERNYLFYVLMIVLPILMVIVLHSVIYDDWRHLYFIYPAFILLGLFAIQKLSQTRLRFVVFAAVAAQLFFVGRFMIKTHPYEQMYFNRLVSHKPEFFRNNYEMDYWGASYKQGLEYILAHDPRPEIKITTDITPLTENNVLILPADQRARIKYADDKNGDYYITNFRLHRQDYSFPGILYNLSVENSSMLRIYKVHL